MARGTVGRGRVTDGGADKGTAAGIMTACTRVMGLRGCTHQRIIMTVNTTCCAYRDACMAGIGRMLFRPGTRMTGRTVGRGRVADGGADQRAAAGIMAAGTSVVRFRGCAYKCIIMTVGA